MKNLFLIILVGCCSFFGHAQDVDGKWIGSFIQYAHNTYDVEMTVEKLAPGNIFSARLRITNGFYFGEYNISGFICNKKNLEISTIVLLRENESGSWIDCLNGTFDLSEDETELTFTDTWLATGQKNNACKVKYIQKDMFQCLRSAYLRKPKYSDVLAEFDAMWQQYDRKKYPVNISSGITPPLATASTAPLVEEPKSETKIVAKNENRAPIIDTFEQVKKRPVQVKDEIEVSNYNITIEYWDRYNEDGDSINLYLNQKTILENVRLTKLKKTITVTLEKGTNYLVLHAINVGTEPPNTASITVKDGKKIQNVSLTSDMRTSGALKIVVKE